MLYAGRVLVHMLSQNRKTCGPSCSQNNFAILSFSVCYLCKNIKNIKFQGSHRYRILWLSIIFHVTFVNQLSYEQPNPILTLCYYLAISNLCVRTRLCDVICFKWVNVQRDRQPSAASCVQLLLFGLNWLCMSNISVLRGAAAFSASHIRLYSHSMKARTSLLSYPVLRLWSVFLSSIVTALTVG